jgi:hypothetical protein
MSARIPSQPDEVEFNLHVASLVSPHIKWGRSDFINERHGKAELHQIYALDIVFAAITEFRASVIVFICVKVSQLGRPLLSTVSTDNSPERPDREAG